MSKENAPLKYEKPSDDIKFVYHKFGIGLRNKKVKIPSYEDESEETFLYMLREFMTMITQHNFLDDQLKVGLVYEFFAETVKGDALDSWLDIINDDEVYNGPMDRASWDARIVAFRNLMLDEEAYDNQKEYLKTTKKPMNLTSKKWIKRMRVINGYISGMANGAGKFTDQELIRYCIKPNLPSSWLKDFKIGGGLVMTSTFQVMELLKIIEENEKVTKTKPTLDKTKSGNGRRKAGKDGKKNEKGFKNKCRKHPDGKHEWKDCYLNPNSKNYKGDKTKDKYNKDKGDESHLILKTKSKKTRSKTKETEVSSDDFWSSDEESNAIVVKDEIDMYNKVKEETVSAEILVTLPREGKNKIFIALLDSGTSASLVSDKVAKLGTYIRKTKSTKWTTQAGNFVTGSRSKLTRLKLPQFTIRRSIAFDAHVFDKKENDKYDLILGRDFMQAIGMNLLYDSKQFQWGEIKVAMVPREFWDRDTIKGFGSLEDNQGDNKNEIFMLDAKYERADLNEVVKNSVGLSDEQKNMLYGLLEKYEKLFRGELGTWEGSLVEIELKPGTKPFHSKAYRIPQALKPILKREVDRLQKIGVLMPNPNSEWAAPSFAIPKKDGTIRFISDFRQLNKVTKRKPFPLPHIRDMLHSIGAMKWATAIDLSMGYYHVKLEKKSRDLVTIILPWGKYCYTALPMGFCGSSDIFQHILGTLFADMEQVLVYLDDIIVIGSGTYKEHLEKIEETLARLLKKGFQVNPRKSFWAQTSVEYLGFIISREGVRPQRKKVQGILDIKEPTSTKQLRGFIGMINFYKEMWKKRAEIMKPLTEKTGKGTKFQWTSEMQKAFKDIKAIMQEDVMLAYPNYEEVFIVHTDASKFQMGGVVSQNDKPIAFFSKKLNKAQRNYTVTEKELLSIVETLKQFKTMLYGQRIIVYTDHKNLTYDNSDYSSDRVLRQRLVLEEYGAQVKYIKGEKNVVADSLSRLPIYEECNSIREADGNQECLLNRRVFEDQTPCPISYNNIKMAQQADKKIKELLQKEEFSLKDYGDFKLVVRHQNDKIRIVIPQVLQQDLMDWFHECLSHPGQRRMYNTMALYYTWKGMKNNVSKFVSSCDKCQKFKKTAVKKYAKLPVRNDISPEPFHTVQVDLIGPWNIEVAQENSKVVTIGLKAVTIIDIGTLLLEIAPYSDKQAVSIAKIFDREWLCRYPRPARVIHDNGTEFTGAEFQEMLSSFDIKPQPTTVKNPQANSIVERIHLTMGDRCRMEDFTYENWEQHMHTVFKSIMWAVRSTVHSVISHTPGQLAFQRDMFMRTKIVVDWESIKNKRLASAQQSNLRENRARIDHTYKIGDFVLIILRDEINRKMQQPTEGPYQILKVNDNGTVKIKRGSYKETIHVRRLKPYSHGRTRSGRVVRPSVRFQKTTG